MPPIVVGAAIAGGAAIASTAIASNAQKKAQQQAEDFANQQAAESRAEQQRLEEKYGLTPGELERENQTLDLEKQRQIDLTRRAGMSGEDLLREGGPTTSALIDRVSGRLGKSSKDLFLEEGGLPAQQLYGEITKEGPPDTFAPELELVRMMVNQEANRRGVFGGLPEGGIRFEQLGRAGVDLAIKTARERIANRQMLSNALLNLSTGARAEAGTVGERSLETSERARAALDQFLGGQQRLVESSKGRALQAAGLASGVGEAGQARAYDTITDVYGQQAGEAAAQKSQGLSALGQLGGDLLSDVLVRNQRKESDDRLYDFLGSREGAAPGQDILALTGREPLGSELEKNPYIFNQYRKGRR